MEAALSAARLILWARTGRRLGVCTVSEGYYPAGGADCGVPYMTDDLVWHNGGRGGPCCAIHLREGPVQSIVSVTELGHALGPSQYRVEQPGRLMRVGACWPVMLECDEPPVRVVYRAGVPLTAPEAAVEPDPLADPPVLGSDAVLAAPLWGMAAAAMGEVTVEVLDGMCGKPCKLPSRAVTITRQGVTVELGAPGDLADSGLLGLPLADALIQAVNPFRRPGRSRVYSVDMARRA